MSAEKSNIEVPVKFLVGTDLKDCILEAKAKAAKWEVAFVVFKFNEASFAVSSTARCKLLMDQYKHKPTLLRLSKYLVD